MSAHAPIIIGVAGGTGSGKTTIANEILQRLGEDKIAYIQHDAYYRNLSHFTPKQRSKVNFDHPDSLETELLIEHLRALIAGQAIQVPVYDFTHHARTTQTLHLEPHPVVLLEGILILVEKALRDLMNVRIFVDTDADIRFIRRLKRDIHERGRSLDSVINQYLNTVRPMHLEFVEPSKRHADVIIPEGGFNPVALDMIVAQIRSLIGAAA